MRTARALLSLAALVCAAIVLFRASDIRASEGEKQVPRDYALVIAPPAPAKQSEEQAAAKTDGCQSCHVETEAPTMHVSPAVRLGCTDCHGGNAVIRGDPRLARDDPAYAAARDAAHVLPRYPEAWHFPSSANPKHGYTLLNREAPEFIRFVNPGDYRVAREACGACHLPTIEAAERSLMSSGAMLWGGAAYNNGIFPLKNYIFGESYTRDGQPAKVAAPGNPPGSVSKRQAARGALAALYPLPRWNVVPPGDVFRVFEDGGRNNGTGFAEVGLPNSTGSIQRLEEPGRPDLKQSSRGPGTGLRVAIPVLNIHKTRLNDPFMWFMGTNDQPGDYRQSGCSGCHVIYANDREPRHSLIYAQFGRDGQSVTVDPTIADKTAGHGGLKGDHNPDGSEPAKESGHPLGHVFTRAIPTAQCMSCHMHQPNVFVNSFLGYTMWDYEADAPTMWPGPENIAPRPAGMSDADYQRLYKRQRYPDAATIRGINARNPEAAAARGLWGDLDFLRNVYDLNAGLKDTQFADYHSHGWNFRGVFKRDRAGNLLDAGGTQATWGTDKAHMVSPDDPQKWRLSGQGKFVPAGVNPGKSVHLMDIHAEKGMQCADCHFAQDSHGNGLIYGEVANAVEIGCADCHGTVDAYPKLLTSGPAAPPKGSNLALLRNPDGQRRFEWIDNGAGRRVLLQRSIVDPNLSWQVHLTKDSVDPVSPYFNLKAARAKLMSRSGADDGSFAFGPGVAKGDRAHQDGKIACFSCHLAWTTSCGGCHLPIEANWKTSMNHFEGEETRNFATYNPQVARDDMFQLGKHMTTKGGEVTPVRSSSALVLSSTNSSRERIYIQQPPISSPGFSSQAFAPHFPHTVRTQETKTCSDCHVSMNEDNNAIMAQTLLLGTNYVNFMGLNAWTGLGGGLEAVRVTEWDEPQAVIGSYLQRYAYPDYFRLHVEQNGRELKNWTRGSAAKSLSGGDSHPLEQFRNVVQGTPDKVGCLQLRGEYVYAAQGKGGFHVYDVAAVANKGFADPIVSAPFAGDAQVDTTDATCMALPTGQPIAPERNTQAMRDANQEQPFLPIYNYAAITDSVEGLILVDVDTFSDGEFRNNKLRRAVTWNPDGVLNGARHIVLAGEVAYIIAAKGLVVVDLSDPLKPRLAAVRELVDARASAVQFRYLWVTDRDGLKLFDVTDLRNPLAVPEATVLLADARRVYVARTYAYVAAKADGLVIVDVTRPREPRIYQKVTFDGQLNDAEDVVVASTNASLFAYVADGRNGMKVLQLTSPESQRNFYGFSPAPIPQLIAWAKTPSPAIAMSKGLDRDRAVDETGGQIAVFGRLGSRPFTRAEMERLFLNSRGVIYKVNDNGDMSAWRAGR